MCSGLEIYNFIVQIYIYIGLFTNTAVIIFGDNYFMPEKTNNQKAIIYLVTVIIIFTVTKIIPWNSIPPWFEYLQEIKDMYNKKYYVRNNMNLPHLYLLDKLKGGKERKHSLKSSKSKI